MMMPLPVNNKCTGLSVSAVPSPPHVITIGLRSQFFLDEKRTLENAIHYLFIPLVHKANEYFTGKIQAHNEVYHGCWVNNT